MFDYWEVKREAKDRHFIIRHLITDDDEYGRKLHSTMMLEELPEHVINGRTPTKVWFHEPEPLGEPSAKASVSILHSLLSSFEVGHILVERVWRDSGPNVLKREVVLDFNSDQEQGEFK